MAQTTNAQRVAAVLAAAAVAVPLLAQFEGYVPVGYPDPALGVKLPTACYGSTTGIVIGKRYTEAECTQMLAADAVKHGLEIDRCLPADLPLEMRAAFTSAAFNIGAKAFCGSSMSRKALTGDYAGACAALSLWNKAGGKEMRGLTRRRAAERQLCERGLA